MTLMVVDHSNVSRRIEKITFDEQRSILQDVVAVDAQFFEHGGANSPAWMLERAGVIILGVRRACAIVADEVRTIAAEDAAEFAAEAGTWTGRLSAHWVSLHREQLVSGKVQATPEEVEASCSYLADALLGECKEVVDDLAYGPLPTATPASPPNLDINPSRLAVVAGRDVTGQAQRINIGALLEIMSEVRRSIETLRIETALRGALIDRIKAVEAFAARPQPHQAMLLALVKCLPPALRMVGAKDAREMVEGFIGQHSPPR
jgi:hypothetical protein